MLIMLPPGDQGEEKKEKGESESVRQEEGKGQSESAREKKGKGESESAREKERPVVRPRLPEVAVEERVLRRTLPDAHLTVAQEASRKARHGRYEVRTLWTLSSADLNGYAGSAGTVGKPWPGLRQVSRIQRVVCQRDQKTGQWKLNEELAYSITSLPVERASAGDILQRWRAHWRIEALHWVRDVTFGEDGSQIHTGQAPEAFSVLRNAAVTLVGLAGFPSIAAGVRELQTRPLGVLTLFASMSSRLKSVGQSGHSPTSQPWPASRVQPPHRQSSLTSAKARDPG